ncbi:MAG: D-TA family PLP-dependent enzyme [Rhizobiaceae bacterium]|nr:D-TA family PLP-dependent enzyme [Rhizobiaceae bacterium]
MGSLLIEDLDTPAVVIDLDIVEANLKRAQDHADRSGLALRPHIKTHKLPHFARMQVSLGAVGITCQKLGEAEVMADAGIADIFVPYNIIGRDKLDRLAALHRRVALSVTADGLATVAGYAGRFTDAGHRLPVLVECDTGAGRCGVQTPRDTLDLARAIDAAPGLRFEGLMTYPPLGRIAEVDAWLGEAVGLLKSSGLQPVRVSNGGTPEYYASAAVTHATEHRPGTYIYSDRMQVSFGHGTLDDCALTVLATVVSRPTPGRAILDAGSKALAADTCRMPGHGTLIGYPDAVVTALSEEHAIVDVSACARAPGIGDAVRIIPNHVCVVSNLFDTVHLVRGGRVVERLPVAARGKLS